MKDDDAFGFRMTDEVGPFFISTVGELRTPYGLHEIGHQRMYETMVFPIVDGRPDYGTDLEVDGYNDANAARAGHACMVQKYRRIVDALRR